MTRVYPVAGTVAAALLVVHTGSGALAEATPSSEAPEAEAAPETALDCPPGTLPDEGVCVRLVEEGPYPAITGGAHRERSGRWSLYDQIPRRPDRPASYDAYRYPVPPGLAGGRSVLSGYDLDRPDPEQRRGRRIRAVGHGGVDLPQVKGTPVRMIRLEHQEGDADVLYAGPLFGTTVLTHHVLREGGELRDYIVLFGHLDGWPPNVKPGAIVRDDEVVGFVGDTGSPELVHLHLEVRRAREGVDLKARPGPSLVQDAISIACDPRNVLPLR